METEEEQEVDRDSLVPGTGSINGHDEASEAEKEKETEAAPTSNTYEGYIMPSYSRNDLEKSMFDKTNSFDVLINK